MTLSVNHILFISVLLCLFLILNVLLIMKNRIESFETIMIGVSIITLVVLATLSTI